MTKNDLIDRIAEKATITKSEVSIVVTSLMTNIIEVVKNGDKVQLIGFGTFSTSERKEKMGRNPQTGEPINIPAATVPKFIPGKFFKEAVNGNQ